MATLPSYGFLPWARQGVASKISEPDTLGSGDGTAIVRADLKAELDIKYNNLDGSIQTNTITKQIQVIGPGDVLGISSKAIVRTEPARGVTNYEDNGLPYIEFYEEDFLWRYSPASAANKNGNQTKLRPWLALVALQDDEYILKQTPGGLPFISVEQSLFNKAFHHQNDTWAFAHVHFNNKLSNLSGDAMQQEVNADISGNPDVAVSRLLCPRKLAKNTSFTAFVIPAYETGRLAGLGLDTRGIPAQRNSWHKGAMPGTGTRPYDFPVYYQWNFRTANYGDFESLVAMLKPIIMDGNSGKMPMDIQNPGFNLAVQNDGTKVIGMEAALKPPDFVPDPWPTNGGVNADDSNTIDKLRTLLNLSADLVDKNAVIASPNPFFNTNIGDDPLLVPPVYGVWHALVSKLGDVANPPWIEELNLDFRNRGAAGLGVKAVQNHQDDFVHRAWQQVNKVNEANKKIQETLLAQAITKCLFKKHIINAGNDKAVMLTHSVQHLIKNSANTKTVQQDFIESRIPFASKTAAFRKVARPNSKVAKVSVDAASGVASLVKLQSIIQNFNITDESNTKAVSAARLKKPPIAALDTVSINNAIIKAVSNYNTSVPDVAKDSFVNMIEVAVIQANASLNQGQLLNEANNQNIADNAVKNAVIDMVNNIVNTSFPVAKNGDSQVIIEFNNAKFKEIFGDGIHAKNYNDVILKDDASLADVSIKSMTTKNDVLALQSSFTDFTNILNILPQVTPVPALNNVESISTHIFQKLDPAFTFVNKLMANIRILQNGAYVPLPQLKTVMAYPEFTEAVYTYLLELSKNFILPNIDKLPNNSITLLENNQSFIEAFMVGMNHEMAKELLWNEYPTDQRGSYFRQFWNIDDSIMPLDPDPEKDKELKLDIRKINTWSHKLGENNPRGTKASNLVLVIRGDLFKKYPNTMVFAQQAEYDAVPSKPRHLKGGIDSNFTKFPLFKAEIDPDITLFGFSLDEATARGDRIEDPHGSTVGKNPGWFFVLKERPGHVHFGLDDFTDEYGNTNVMPVGNPATWDDLAWEYLVNSKADLDTYHITFNKNIAIKNPANQPLWNSNSADLAAILFQDPVLFARHAGEMLPEN